MAAQAYCAASITIEGSVMTCASGRGSPTVVLTGLLLAIALGSWATAQPARKPVELPPLQPQQVENTQLLANPGFETPDTGWNVYEWPPREDTSTRLTGKFITYSQDVVHSGKYALCFDFATLTPERTLGATQDLAREALAPYEGRMIRSSAWIWVARGPSYYQGSVGTRQWGEPGTPVLDYHIIPLGGPMGVWIECSEQFRLKLGDTQRLDFNLWLPNVPDATQAPVVYVDDASLEVLADPPLAAELIGGRVIWQPDTRVPVRVTVAEQAWQEGLRSLQWDVTSADGLRSYASGKLELPDRQAVVEAALPNLAEGDYAVRLALGAKPGDRSHEVLLPIRRAEGPFGK